MLVSIPIGLWVFSVVADLIYHFGWGRAVWKDVAFYAIGGGIVGALLAAVPGFIDFLDDGGAGAADRYLPHGGQSHRRRNFRRELLAEMDRRARRSSRRSVPAGLVVLGLAGWLGGELVFVHSMGVKPPPATSRQAAAGSQRRIA